MDTLDIQSNANQENNSKWTYEPLEGTPFTIIGDEEGYFAVMGKHRITERTKSKEKLVEDLKVPNWNRITQMIYIITNNYTNE